MLTVCEWEEGGLGGVTSDQASIKVCCDYLTTVQIQQPLSSLFKKKSNVTESKIDAL